MKTIKALIYLYFVSQVKHQQSSFSPQILGAAIDPQQTSQGQLHVFFFVILF